MLKIATEIRARRNRFNEYIEVYDESTGSKYMVYDGNQWISYDDAETFKDKRKFMDDRCIGGVMIWAIDQDTDDFQALSGLLGDDIVEGALLEGGSMSDEEKEALRDELGGLTGDSCYITTGCTGPGTNDTKLSECRSGYSALEKVHEPGDLTYRTSGYLQHENRFCPPHSWKTICCKSSSTPQNCNWRGGPERSSL